MQLLTSFSNCQYFATFTFFLLYTYVHKHMCTVYGLTHFDPKYFSMWSILHNQNINITLEKFNTNTQQLQSIVEFIFYQKLSILLGSHVPLVFQSRKIISPLFFDIDISEESTLLVSQNALQFGYSLLFPYELIRIKHFWQEYYIGELWPSLCIMPRGTECQSSHQL